MLFEESNSKNTIQKAHSEISLCQSKSQGGELNIETHHLQVNQKKKLEVEQRIISLGDEKIDQSILELNKAKLHSIQNPFEKVFIKRVLQNFHMVSCENDNFRCNLDNTKKFRNISVLQLTNNSLNYSCPLDSSTGRCIRKKEFVRRMSSLIKWLLLIHKANQTNLSPNMSQKEEEESLNQLIDWLVSETFTPEISVPVIGLIRQENHSMDRNAFRDVQIILIYHLSQNQSEKTIVVTSCFLLLIWYEKMQKKEIQNLHQVFNEEKVGYLIENLTSNAKTLKRKFQKNLKSIFPTKYGDFELPKEKIYFPKNIYVPKGNLNSIGGYDISHKASSMVQRIEEFYQRRISHAHEPYYFQDLPVYLVVDSSSNNGNSRLVKISTWKQETKKFQTIANRVDVILTYLILSQCSLVEAISKADTKNTKINYLKRSKSHFIDWIEQELFNPTGSLPVFGTVENVDEPFDRTKFGDNQIAFLEYFSSPDGYKIAPSISIGFLGSWLKKFDKEKWKDRFYDDCSFSKFMMKKLMADQNKFKDFRRKRNQ
jgi:hypothetical protein